ncbi:hypothetical protein I8H83_04195 [Candidatus Saccharibacteria bacterium]|nr:hypothetical protein [Candidatus Saccharibacteria bacterium]MBH2007779.1 hypothetical protein [Candidatus Saccharibacteria bacterium]
MKWPSRTSEPLVSPALVRVVASVLLVIGIFLIYIAATNYEMLGIWPAILIGFGGVTTSGLAIVSIITADPTWIMLDLILPG